MSLNEPPRIPVRRFISPLLILTSVTLLGGGLFLFFPSSDSSGETASETAPDAAPQVEQVARRRPRIDVHTHFASSVARRGLRALRAEGIEIVFNASGGATTRRRTRSAQLQGSTGGALRWWCNLSFQHADADGWMLRSLASLEECAALGGAGLKISKSLGLG